VVGTIANDVSRDRGPWPEERERLATTSSRVFFCLFTASFLIAMSRVGRSNISNDDDDDASFMDAGSEGFSSRSSETEKERNGMNQPKSVQWLLHSLHDARFAAFILYL